MSTDQTGQGNQGSHPPTATRHLGAGEILFREGDKSECMYLIQSGQVSVRRMRGLKMIEIARLQQGEVLGELSFFDRAPRSATAVAHNDVTILEIPFEGLDRVYNQVPQYMKSIITGVVNRLRKANDTIRALKNEDNHGNEAPATNPGSGQEHEDKPLPFRKEES